MGKSSGYKVAATVTSAATVTVSGSVTVNPGGGVGGALPECIDGLGMPAELGLGDVLSGKILEGLLFKVLVVVEAHADADGVAALFGAHCSKDGVWAV